jgi:imidazolonepropionase
VAAGANGDLRAAFHGRAEIDARDQVVCPGFVDPHTHLVYAGDRVGEFELKRAGASYLEILAAGGGILSTMQATRAASLENLTQLAAARLAQMLAFGSTTVECKSGYGLSTQAELKQLAVLSRLHALQPVDLVPTALCAHALPPEYKGRPDDYVRRVCDEMLPAAAEWHNRSPFATGPIYVDVFCERAAFDAAQARVVLSSGRAAGMAVKAHVDQFNEIGGLDVALSQHAASVDHLDVTGADGIARIAASDAVAVVIPAVPFHLGGQGARYADARGMVDAGCALALTTDLNPGSAPCYSMQFVMALACRQMGLNAAEALVASTLNAAHAIGQGGHAGSIEPGKRADVLILDAPDYRHLTYQFGGNLVRTVIKRGRVAQANQR